MTYSEQTLDGFLSGIASERVAPAGGTAVAVVGAIGASLCEMVCIHSAGDDERPAGGTALRDVRCDLRRQRDHLLDLAEADARTVDELFPSQGGMDQSGVKRSIGVPLTIADACLNVLELATDITVVVSSNVVIDAGTGVFLADAALRASVFTLRSNVDMVSDPSFVSRIERDAAEIERRGQEAYERAMANIDGRV